MNIWKRRFLVAFESWYEKNSICAGVRISSGKHPIMRLAPRVLRPQDAQLRVRLRSSPCLWIVHPCQGKRVRSGSPEQSRPSCTRGLACMANQSTTMHLPRLPVVTVLESRLRPDSQLHSSISRTQPWTEDRLRIQLVGRLLLGRHTAAQAEEGKSASLKCQANHAVRHAANASSLPVPLFAMHVSLVVFYERFAALLGCPPFTSPVCLRHPKRYCDFVSPPNGRLIYKWRPC